MRVWWWIWCRRLRWRLVCRFLGVFVVVVVVVVVGNLRGLPWRVGVRVKSYGVGIETRIGSIPCVGVYKPWCMDDTE